MDSENKEKPLSISSRALTWLMEQPDAEFTFEKVISERGKWADLRGTEKLSVIQRLLQ
jgi:hypothetical protein